MSDLSDRLFQIHGTGNCHICGQPKVSDGSPICSYPHGMVQVRAVDQDRPEGFWIWEYPNR